MLDGDISLLGQRPPQPMCGRVVANVVGVQPVLERIRHCRTSLAVSHIWHPALRPLAMVSSPQSKVDDAAQDLVAADLGVVSVMQAGGWRTPRMVTRCSEHHARRAPED